MPATTADTPPTTGKTRVLADLEAIEAMADQPAIEAVAEDAEQASPALEDEAVADSPMEPSVAELLEEADRAQLEGDYDSAIGLYWQALATANNDPATWNQLSQAYFAINQLQNAETAALEAIRFAPSEIKYTLDYLRIAQRSKPATQFLAELETAYDRFPSNPEVALSLARAHERIGNNSRAAQSLYRRFLEIAPNHPLRAEADAALARLR
jgi:tetratricopeptide (TPR) repeat protein